MVRDFEDQAQLSGLSLLSKASTLFEQEQKPLAVVSIKEQDFQLKHSAVLIAPAPSLELTRSQNLPTNLPVVASPYPWQLGASCEWISADIGCSVLIGYHLEVEGFVVCTTGFANVDGKEISAADGFVPIATKDQTIIRVHQTKIEFKLNESEDQLSKTIQELKLKREQMIKEMNLRQLHHQAHITALRKQWLSAKFVDSTLVSMLQKCGKMSLNMILERIVMENPMLYELLPKLKMVIRARLTTADHFAAVQNGDGKVKSRENLWEYVDPKTRPERAEEPSLTPEPPVEQAKRVLKPKARSETTKTFDSSAESSAESDCEQRLKMRRL